MAIFTDQLGNKIELHSTPKRIISLVPSQTELLYDLGLDDEVIGITKFCVHPQSWFRSKTRVGGTKKVDVEKILSLKPDLIIANKEENVKEQIEALQQIAPVWVSDINNLDEALNMIGSLGEITGSNEKAREISGIILKEFQKLPVQTIVPGAYLIWKEPYMTIGGDTFINDMMQRCGLQNVFAQLERYPEVTLDEIKTSGCKLLLLSSEPYPFKEKHKEELAKQLPDIDVLLVDGEMFSWYGSRLQYAPVYFRQMLKGS